MEIVTHFLFMSEELQPKSPSATTLAVQKVFFTQSAAYIVVYGPKHVPALIAFDRLCLLQGAYKHRNWTIVEWKKVK